MDTEKSSLQVQEIDQEIITQNPERIEESEGSVKVFRKHTANYVANRFDNLMSTLANKNYCKKCGGPCINSTH